MGGISLYVSKELNQTYQPLLLAELSLPNGQFLHLSTHPLSNRYGGNPTVGSYQYGNIEWLPRLLDQNIGATQAMSDIGVDIPPTVTLKIADPDKTILQYEKLYGLKGTVLKLYATMWDVGNTATGSFSSNSPAPIKFIGICSAPSTIDDSTLVITATSLLNMNQQMMPPVRIQPLCPWTFPTTTAAMDDGLNNDDSPFYQCGYSYGRPSGVGNASSGTAAFTFCDLSYSACVARLGNSANASPLWKDESGNHTGRFGGFDFVPVQYVGLQRSYSTGQWDLIINASNQARYGDYIPLAYGTCWVEPEMMGFFSDGNYTTFEAMLCFGLVQNITTMVVNGDVIPQLSADYSNSFGNTINSAARTNTFVNNFWTTINNGQRGGTPNAAAGWGSKGDSYGSCAAVYVHCVNQLVAPNSIPQMQVLLTAGQVRVYSNTTTWTNQYSSNPAWILLNLLVQANWRYSDVDLQSFIDAAAVCDTQIYFNSISGSYQNVYNEPGSPAYTRYSIGFSVRQRTAIGQLIQGVRNSMRGMLFFDFNSGKLKLLSKSTLAAQQPSPITGSNYNTAVSSVTTGGISANGYAAYLFDGSGIAEESSGRSSLKIIQQGYQNTPNKVMTYFFDRENQYNQDISTITDVEDVSRIGSEVTGTFNLIGPQTYDHLNRVTNTWFSEMFRGNPRLDYTGSAVGDTGGTWIVEFKTSVKAIHLMVGHIILLTDFQNGLTNQAFRITRIQPSVNFETATITAQWHNDNWYQDTYGQGANQPIYKNPMAGANINPRPIRPNYEAPQTGDAYAAATELNFGVAQSYSTTASGLPIATMSISTQLPVNAYPSVFYAPLLYPVAAGDQTGGYSSGTSYFVSLSGMAADGSLGPLSRPCAVNLTAPSNAIDISVQGWPAQGTGYFAFAGTDPNLLSFQQSAAVEPTTVKLTNTFQVGSWGPPDSAFSYLQALVSVERHAGVLGGTVTSVTSGSITISVYTNYGMTVNQFAGRELVVLGAAQGGNFASPVYSPIANFPISSNTSSTFTLSAGNPTTCVYGSSVAVGDAVAVRFLPTFGQDGTGYYFEDLQLVNALNSIGVMYPVSGASSGSPITIQLPLTGSSFPFTNGQFVVVQGVGGIANANGGFTVGSVNTGAGTFQLVGSSGAGSYTSGGWVAIQARGFAVNAESGKIAFAVSGTGKGMQVKLASNTSTRCYISGTWPVTPDSSTRLVILDNNVKVFPVSQPVSNSVPKFSATYPVDVTNYGRQAVFVQLVSVATTGNTAPLTQSPFRELFLFGAQNERTVTAATTMLQNDGLILADTSLGSFAFQCLSQSLVPRQTFVFRKITSDANTVTITAWPGELFPSGNSTIVLSSYNESVTVQYD